MKITLEGLLARFEEIDADRLARLRFATEIAEANLHGEDNRVFINEIRLCKQALGINTEDPPVPYTTDDSPVRRALFSDL